VQLPEPGACKCSDRADRAPHLVLAEGRDSSTFFPHTVKQAVFEDQMRKLWEDHVTWTRLVIVSAVGGTNGEALPNTGPTVQRLQNPGRGRSGDRALLWASRRMAVWGSRVRAPSAPLVIELSWS